MGSRNTPLSWAGDPLSEHLRDPDIVPWVTRRSPDVGRARGWRQSLSRARWWDSPVRLLDPFRLGSLTLTIGSSLLSNPHPPKRPVTWAGRMSASRLWAPPACWVGGPLLILSPAAHVSSRDALHAVAGRFRQCGNPSMEGTVTVAEKKSLVAHGTALIPLWLLDTFLLGDGLSPPRGRLVSDLSVFPHFTSSSRFYVRWDSGSGFPFPWPNPPAPPADCPCCPQSACMAVTTWPAPGAPPVRIPLAGRDVRVGSARFPSHC